MFEKSGGILFCGTEATLFVDRREYILVPEGKGERVTERSESSGNERHWANFLECVRTREKPTSDIEKCFRSSSTCLLGNIALRSKLRLDWDVASLNLKQPEARPFLKREYRKPWKLIV
jgi:hypothetical protein